MQECKVHPIINVTNREAPECMLCGAIVPEAANDFQDLTKPRKGRMPLDSHLSSLYDIK